MWEFWVQFERGTGRTNLTVAELKKEVLKSGTTSSQSTVSQIHELLSKNGTVDIHALSGMH